MRLQTGASCLYIACQNGHLDVVKYLYERGGERLLMLTNNVRVCACFDAPCQQSTSQCRQLCRLVSMCMIQTRGQMACKIQTSGQNFNQLHRCMHPYTISTGMSDMHNVLAKYLTHQVHVTGTHTHGQACTHWQAHRMRVLFRVCALYVCVLKYSWFNE